MKLDKSQRFTAYVIMLQEAYSPSIFYDESESREFISTYAGFCYMFYLLTMKIDLFEAFENTLPELYSKKPINEDRFWFAFGKWDERAELLKQCIEETADF